MAKDDKKKFGDFENRTLINYVIFRNIFAGLFTFSAQILRFCVSQCISAEKRTLIALIGLLNAIAFTLANF